MTPLLEMNDSAYKVSEKEILSGLSLAGESGEVHGLNPEEAVDIIVRGILK